MSHYVLITENIYINSIYFAAMTCEITLAGLINSDQKHIDVGPTRIALSGLSHPNAEKAINSFYTQIYTRNMQLSSDAR